MKRIITLFILCLGLSAYAQDITITPYQVNFELDGTEESKKVGYTLANNGTTDLNWYWKLTLSDDFPKEWDIQVCDQTLCWAYGMLERGTDDNGNPLSAGTATNPTFTYVQVRTNGAAGTGLVEFCIYDDKEFSSEVLCTDFSTSVKDELLASVDIYPNPAQSIATIDMVIEEAADVSLVVMDMVGKVVANQKVGQNLTGAVSHTLDVSDFDNGTYLVQIQIGDRQTVQKINVAH